MMTAAERAILSEVGIRFSIDEKGRVWRAGSWRRAEHRTPLGYLQVRWMQNGKRHHAFAHRIVWMHFTGLDLLPGTQINHKNGVKGDNRPDNLEAVTPSENIIHARRVLRVGDQHGEKNHAARLTESIIEAIRSRRRAGESLRSIADDYGISFKTVSKICRGDRWAHAKGPVDRHRKVVQPPRIVTDGVRREILSMAARGISHRQIAESCGVSKTTATRIISNQASSTWPHPTSGGRLLDGRTWDEYPNQKGEQRI